MDLVKHQYLWEIALKNLSVEQLNELSEGPSQDATKCCYFCANPLSVTPNLAKLFNKGQYGKSN